MNTSELTNILASHPITRSYFGGVRASDELWETVDKPLIIVNNQSSDQPGQHWMTLFLDSTPEFFDSLGKGASFYGDIQDFLICHGPQYLCNTQRIQKHGTSSCGIYCLYYAFYKCCGFTMDNIMNNFTNNLSMNERIVNNFYETNIKHDFVI